MAKHLPDLTHLAQPGAEIALRVTPRAARDRIDTAEGALRIYVTAPPEDGKANKAVQKILARAMGVAKSRLVLVRGQTARDKVFRLE
ncbi:DUF167 domain-containing protein [Lutimaribacter sp. EGI FJ00015]|uniref:DUF167 domain-containing protein n=1 Tax=Lutimaribacter degradans TaxID=2945989 RepID=A0ACC5ZU54_9RHOB|nr:DUF167 domain-containing protein [Lutimaribacter sp. EGI FJ00013]MCM2561597.1 DUF167 domain-containing protein [Lutimaribacter sp. EGI FJ00013]MCO0612692.1 DUF167 domain-containing protein [Lutimaribacter sp. EGI FJ00015]MCO0635350.1 DUF167 domain-containing protein [Lutimaribacter sp. EGI FJ00014]